MAITFHVSGMYPQAREMEFRDRAEQARLEPYAIPGEMGVTFDVGRILQDRIQIADKFLDASVSFPEMRFQCSLIENSSEITSEIKGCALYPTEEIRVLRAASTADPTLCEYEDDTQDHLNVSLKPDDAVVSAGIFWLIHKSLTRFLPADLFSSSKNVVHENGKKLDYLGISPKDTNAIVFPVVKKQSLTCIGCGAKSSDFPDSFHVNPSQTIENSFVDSKNFGPHNGMAPIVLPNHVAISIIEHLRRPIAFAPVFSRDHEWCNLVTDFVDKLVVEHRPDN